MKYKGDVNSWEEWIELKNKGYTEVKGDFDCSDDDLTSLKGAPEKIGGWFNCSLNKLTTLEGAPKSVGGRFSCWGNNLKTLNGAPEKVGGEFKSDIVNTDDWEEYYLLHFKDGEWSEKEIPFEEMDKVKQTKLLAIRLGGK